MADRFAEILLREGRLRVGADPTWALSDESLDAMKSALATQSLHLPGPRLVGSLDALIRAVPVVYRFAWRFLNSEPTPVDKDASLHMPDGPRSAADHLAADLAFRFLPGLLQRVVARNPQDDLAAGLTNLLRQWPLSGVLAEIAEPPLEPLLLGHPGVAYLYAERFAKRERPGWLPTGSDFERVELVYDVLGRPVPLQPGE